MQSLLSIPCINFYFYKKQYLTEQPDNNKKKPLHAAVHKFVKQLVDGSGSQTHEIKELASCFENKFNPYEQHDVQEFFLHISNLLQDEIKLDSALPKVIKDSESAYYFYMNSNRSIIDRAFAGQVSSTILCKACNEESVSYVPFIDLCLEITEATL